MMISHQHRLVFTHIPKNAGTSIKAWFQRWVPDARPEHLPLGTHKHHTPHHLQPMPGYTHLAVVRNPYDRLLSQYYFHLEAYTKYLSRGNKWAKKKSVRDTYNQLQQGFDNWLTDPYPIADRHAKWYDYRWCPQAMWCTEDTHVLKFETLEEDFEWVQDRVGVQEPLETLNSTGTDNDHTTSANRVLLAPHRPLIQSHLMVDFLRFGYAPDFNRSGKLGG